MDKTESDKSQKRCGFVSVVGAPNVGKSTLVNTLTGAKVSITSPKAQTTRNRIRGIRIHEDTQIILVDTPGIFNLTGKLNNILNKSIVETAKNSLEGEDKIAVTIDSSKKLSENDRSLIELVKELNQPKILILNKVDKIEKPMLLELSQKLNEMMDFEATFMVSALKRKGTEDILKYLSKNLPEGPYLYPEDEISDFPMRMLAAEVTREKLIFSLKEEIPYNIMVETESYEETKKGIKINQAIYTTSEAHKRIIIGKNGSLIKKIGEQSRKELSQITETPVHLFLFVKVRENWLNNRSSIVSTGMDFAN